jgi:ATP-binding cassette subfamily B protein
VILVQGTLPAAMVWLSRPLVDTLVEVLGVGAGTGPDWTDLGPLLSLAALFAALLVLGQGLDALGAFIRTAQAELVKDRLSDLVHHQSGSLDLAFYDSAAFYDHLHQARDESFYRPVSLLEHLGGMLQNGITLALLALVLLPYGAWLPLALIASALPALAVILRHSRRRHAWWLESTTRDRRAWYYSWLLTAREAAMELRLLGLAGYYCTAHQHLRHGLRRERLGLARAEALAQAGSGLIGMGITAAVLGWMLLRALHGQATPGDLALFQQAFQRGQGIMGALLGSAGQVYANSLFLSNLFDFLGLRPGLKDPAEPVEPPGTGVAGLAPGIVCRGLRFRYPGARREVFAGLDLDIAPGAITAILGGNGAGKSTLIKLLCRLYDPQGGAITLGGADLRDIGQDVLRSRLAVLTQEPVRYSTSAAECIGLGDLTEAGPSQDATAIASAAEAAGAEGFIAGLPQGYATPLGLWFEGGVELSGGQWQRLALARALIRRAPVLILDEPTSALDPWAEARWLDGLRGLTRGRTVLLITHRLTAAALADRIHVMEGGQVLECGSHAELLRRGGPYAAAWGVAGSACAAGQLQVTSVQGSDRRT